MADSEVYEHPAAKEGAFRWFGPSWGAPVCDDVPHDQTPVGAECRCCHQRIKEGDQGFIFTRALFPAPQLGDGMWAAVFDPFHLDCWMRTITERKVGVREGRSVSESEVYDDCDDEGSPPGERWWFTRRQLQVAWCRLRLIWKALAR